MTIPAPQIHVYRVTIIDGSGKLRDVNVRAYTAADALTQLELVNSNCYPKPKILEIVPFEDREP